MRTRIIHTMCLPFKLQQVCLSALINATYIFIIIGNSVPVTARVYSPAQDPILPENTIAFAIGALNAPANNVSLYSRWKGWNLRNDCQSMREDWEKLLLVIPEHIPWGRACAAKVVSVLRELVPHKSGN